MTRDFNARAGLDLLEEVFHLLRKTRGAAFALLYLGTIPFCIGFLYFWADMSRSAFAEERCVMASLGLSVLFLWMKICQAGFCGQLRAQVMGDDSARPSWRHRLREFAWQSFLQPVGLILFPLSLIAVLPAAWVYAFTQNVSVLGREESLDLKSLVRDSWRQACLWPRQNHIGLFILSLLGLFVYLNISLTLFMLPFLLKGLLGIETSPTRGPMTFMNSTFQATSLVLTFLCMDPVVKAFYVLRCFYGHSLKNGDDLRVALRTFASAGALVCFLSLGCHTLEGAEVSSSSLQPPASSLSSQEMDQAIEQVIQLPEFTWRMPREKPEKKERVGLLGHFFRSLIDQVDRLMSGIREVLERIMIWILDRFSKFTPQYDPKTGQEFRWPTGSQLLIFGVLALVACVLALFLLRMRRTPQSPEMVGEAMEAPPDLRNDEVSPEALPLDGWLKLAQELQERGDLRLALRALYLAILSFLADQDLIALARYKSNRDYLKELARRAHALPDLPDSFASAVRLFDRTWYGAQEVTPKLMAEFLQRWERIRTYGA